MAARGRQAEEPLRTSRRPTDRLAIALYTVPIFRMSFARFSLSLVAVIGVMAITLAGATIWLLVTQPVTVADAVAQGEVSPLAKALAGVLYEALQGLLKYL